ncbi:NADH-quinone oxidoreductase subunit M [Cocleimonas sp. KMM 6892]|uniref:NADH-quinone oxidoreductase subunit M n=1 Tax=unclassified Cocleimonas TaxID=2639732 RepID=UPI002DBFD405|nr:MULTISPECIES: NADH-quinone oxidoreductase subunit M [unclassified Cocleimonas]MEB8430657.1 NADH-quinone oxidoreductase subunit M [Cocleimonas sp. KMM 6892]MEC4716892.1 NADH-quinone oxidoreductase subunit M [Cocleimonas sp. KMM 6895]MEC4743904.1 NADH-quinone oxidoreductase subunit M [Cocleimonas sp. KMM 6896]
MFEGNLLSILIWLPIIGGLILLFTGDKFAPRPIALIFSVLTFLLSIPLWTDFNPVGHQMQFVELAPWIEAFKINYHLGVDGISMPLILLNAFITVLIVIAGWEVIKHKPAQYMAAFLIMEGIINGVFAAQDSILFYVFFEAMLIPMFIVIGIWGGDNRIYATIKFFLYTFFGSVFMLISLVYMYSQADSFAIADFHSVKLGMTPQILIFLSFLIAFGVKVPMWPVHTWLPDAHVQAPTGGSVILAAVMLKIGGYGFIRFSLPMVPDASSELAWLVIFMSLTAIVYIGFIALVQNDMKKLVAYSSIAHMGFVTLGFFVLFPIVTKTGSAEGTLLGLQGGMVQMMSHGFISGAMFLCIGVLYDRMHTRDITAYGGVSNRMPWFAGFFVLFAMANTGLPGTSGFVGEFMVILTSFKANFWIAFLAATTLIIGAAYTLWLVKRVIFGAVANSNVAELTDINKRETVILAALAFFVLLLGLWPEPLVHVMNDSLAHVVEQATTSKLGN